MTDKSSPVDHGAALPHAVISACAQNECSAERSAVLSDHLRWDVLSWTNDLGVEHLFVLSNALLKRHGLVHPDPKGFVLFAELAVLFHHREVVADVTHCVLGETNGSGENRENRREAIKKRRPRFFKHRGVRAVKAEHRHKNRKGQEEKKACRWPLGPPQSVTVSCRKQRCAHQRGAPWRFLPSRCKIAMRGMKRPLTNP